MVSNTGKKKIKVKFGDLEVEVFFKKGKDGLYYGITGSDEHLTHLNKSGLLSVHKTKNLKKGEKERTQILGSIEDKKLIPEVNKELEDKILGDEYLKDDLFLLNMDVLLNFLNRIKNPKVKKETAKETEAVLDISELFQYLKELIEKEGLFYPIQRKDIAAYESHTLVNSKNQLMLVYRGKVRPITDLQQGLYGGKSGALFGYEALGLLDLMKLAAGKGIKDLQ